MCVFLFILLVATVSANAADIPFTVAWDPVTKKLNGEPGTPAEYKLYVCDAPITKTPWVSGSVQCSGNLLTLTTTGTEVSGVYNSTVDSGLIQFRVTALDSAGNESPISNLATLVYSTSSLTFEPPEGFQLNNRCVTIINTP